MVILGSKEKLCTSLMEGMNSLRKDEILVDVCIKVGDDQIMAHKSVLVSASEYFNSCFVGPLKTEDNDGRTEVDLSTIVLDVESVEAVVEFIYTGLIDIHDENLEAILKLATFLLIIPLEELCIEFMEQCCDLNSFMRYYLLSVDYMFVDAEWIMVRTVKPRFHDWFIFQESTRILSPYHLQKLIEDHDIFEHCTKTDRLTFLVDWVLGGKTEEHEELMRKIIDGDVAPIRYNETQIDSEPQSDDIQKGVDEPNTESDPQKDHGKLQDTDELQSDDKQPCLDGTDGEKQACEDATDSDKLLCEHVTGGDKRLCDGAMKKSSKHVKKRCHDDSVKSNNGLGSGEAQGNENREKAELQRHGYDTPQSLEKIKSKLQSANCSQDFVEKCSEVIDHLNSQNTDDIQLYAPGASCQMLQKLEPDVEHVLIAVVPKKLLKDFHQEVHQLDDTILAGADDAIFDICVYSPQKLTWYYFGEGKNIGKFKEMSEEENTSTFSFCMLDYLCFASKCGSHVLMYSLKQCDRNGKWSSNSYKDIKTELHNPGPFGFDRNSYNAKLFSRDGKILYLVLKITDRGTTEDKVKFKCYWSSFPKSRSFVSETPFMHESEDFGIKIGRFEFDVNVSQGNKELLILAKGAKLHVFVADLQNREREMKHSIIEGAEKESDEYYWRRNTHAMGNGNHVSLVDELQMDERLHYRNRKVDISGSMAVEHTTDDMIDTRFPSDYQEFRETPVKLSQRVNDGTSLWLYLSDSKFETSLTEIRPDENGIMDFIDHTPPPFTAITLLAAGKVRSKHLADLKPMMNFLLDS